MQHTPTTSTGARRLRGLVAAAIMTVGALGAAGVATVTASPAGAAGVATYQATVTQPGPLAGNFSQTSGGDGWAVALTATQVFAVAHHQAALMVACHNQSDASACWSTAAKTVTNGSTNYATSPGPGLYLNQSTGKLYVWVTEVDNSQAGVACIDTTKPAADTGAQMFCGFTPLSGVGDAPTYFAQYGTYSGISAPAQVGTNWYAFNAAPLAGVGAGTNGTENTLMCFSLTTFSACATKTHAVPLGGVTLSAFEYSSNIAAVGSDIMIPAAGTIASAAADEMGCFDTTTNTTCSGTWPIATPLVGGNAVQFGAPFPFLSSTGVQTGVCLPMVNNPCFSLTGSVVTTPAHMPATVGTNDVLNGPAVVNTTLNRVYVPNAVTNVVDCFDYTTDATCTNFPKPFTNLSDLYTVNPDPYRTNCLWVNSDHGTGQIQDFNAISGTTCAAGPIRIAATTAVSSSNPNCVPQSYSTLQVTSPPANTYRSGVVQFANAQGAIQAITPVPLNSFGIANLAGTNFTTDPEPEFVITLNGLSSEPATVAVKLTWQATFASACYNNGQTVSTKPGYWLGGADAQVYQFGNTSFYGPYTPIHPTHPVVGIASLANHSGYWEVATDGGIFAFGNAGFYGSTGSLTLNKPIVGMAPTPTGKGYWLVASDGGIFSYGDARFYGSAGSIQLNKPIVGMAATPDGGGYWLVATDGGIFAYGDAAFYGSMGSTPLNKPIVGMTANPNGGGYWLVASDGGIFTFGNLTFYGSTGSIVLNKPIVGMSSTFDGKGYWMVATDGGIFNYGDAGFAGSTGSKHLSAPISGMAS